jgi:hypothetical protein
VITFPTVISRTYTVEMSEALSDGNWSMIGSNIDGTGNDVTNRIGQTSPAGFIRVRAQP